MKSRPGMEALINDSQTEDLDILLIQEPPLSAYQTHVNHRCWQLYQPTDATDEGVRKRSLVYVNKRISTSAHRQLQCNSPDVSAVKVWTEDTQFLIFSVYIPPIAHTQMSQNVSMQSTLDEIQATIDASQDNNRTTKIIMAGDFNRHHPAWSNRQVYYLHLRHSEELLAFIQDHRMQWGLPSGTPTYWSLSCPGTSSTLNLTLTNMLERIIKCYLYHNNYGSDH